ncbi:unnamed protein product [Lupinus luteus]|uniref:VQ domain-containing protein n=1 Tax=Lupinus luteus TaxID=3873 RepID=A0AAV1XD60_LUPLU
MNSSEFNSAGGTRNPPPSSSFKYPQRNEPRPIVPPKVSPESHKIKKPPLVPASPAGIQHHHAPTVKTQKQRKPTIIYEPDSPRIITVKSAADFKEIVQRLTGLPRPEGESPEEARDASIEHTTGMSVEGTEVGPFPGVISPVPTTMPPAVPSGFFTPEKETLPIRDDLRSALSSAMNSMSMTESKPFSEELWSSVSRPMDSLPVTETVPFRQDFRAARSVPMYSMPVTGTVPFRQDFRATSSVPMYSIPVRETVPFRHDFRATRSIPMDSLPVPGTVPFSHGFRAARSVPMYYMPMMQTVPFRQDFRATRSIPMYSMPVRETVSFRDDFRAMRSIPMYSMPVRETVPFRDDFSAAHNRSMNSLPATETVPFNEELCSGNSSLPNQSSVSLSPDVVYFPPPSPLTSPTREVLDDKWYESYYPPNK